MNTRVGIYGVVFFCFLVLEISVLFCMFVCLLIRRSFSSPVWFRWVADQA